MPQIASILTSVKKNLGIAESYTAFDHDIITHINSVCATLHQLGVGPSNGFMIDDASELWSEFIGSKTNINSVKSYMYVKVRLLFDPPATSFAITAMEKQAAEFEWRLEVAESPSLIGASTGSTLWNLTNKTDFPTEAAPGDIGVDLDTGTIWSNNG